MLTGSDFRGNLLLGRVVGELDTLADVALQVSNSLLQETLLLLSDTLERVLGLLGTLGL